jgi:hypothetical protein
MTVDTSPHHTKRSFPDDFMDLCGKRDSIIISSLFVRNILMFDREGCYKKTRKN